MAAAHDGHRTPDEGFLIRSTSPATPGNLTFVISKMTIDASGKTAKVDWENKLSNTNGSYVMVKQ